MNPSSPTTALVEDFASMKIAPVRFAQAYTKRVFSLSQSSEQSRPTTEATVVDDCKLRRVEVSISVNLTQTSLQKERMRK